MTSRTSPAPETTAARDRMRRMEGRAAVTIRAGGFANVLVGVVAVRDGFTHYPAAVALVVVVAAESALLAVRVLRSGPISNTAATADLVFNCALLMVNTAVIRPAALRTWAYFAYPYALSSTILYGLAYLRAAAAIASVVAEAGAYVAACAVTGELTGDVAPNAISFLAIGPLTWLVTREVRATSRELDRARTDAENAAAALSRERERAYHHRILHDRVLQTLELLGNIGRGVPEPLREHIATEAAWLRQLVETGTEREPSDLLDGLNSLAATARRLGLRVQVRAAQLVRPDSPHRRLPPESVDALLGAAGESLANVLKHAGVADAVLRATTDGTTVTITVADAGRGFDPAAAGRGTGIPRSIVERMDAVGGSASIDSSPDLGTRVTLSANAPPHPAGA